MATQAMAAATSQSFRCYNNVYRESVLAFNKDQKFLLIGDTIVDASRIHEIVERKLGGTVYLHKISVRLGGKQPLNCSQSATWFVKCDIRDRRAILRASGWIYNGDIGGSIDLNIPVTINSLRLQTKLHSSGEHNTGSKNTLVKHNILEGKASVNLTVDGETIDLQYNPSFLISRQRSEAGKSPQYCQTY